MAKDITLKTRNGETRYPKSVTALIYENGTGKTLQTIIDEMRQVDADTNTRTQHFKADVNNLDTLKNKTDIGLYNYVGTGWRGSVSVCYDSADNVSQVALSSSTPSYNGNTLTWISAQPCAMARTYTNGAWSHWEKVGAPVVNDLTTGGTDKALSAEMGKTLKEGLDALGPKCDQIDVSSTSDNDEELIIGESTNDPTISVKDKSVKIYGTLQLNGGAVPTSTDLAGKVDKVVGKGLSTNDFTNEDKSKVDSLPDLTQSVGDEEEEVVFGESINDPTLVIKDKITSIFGKLLLNGIDINNLFGNVLFGKKWVVVGDSFSTNADETVTDDSYIDGGLYDGYLKDYGYIIGNRNYMNIVNFHAGGKTMAYPSDDTFQNAFANPNQSYATSYLNVPNDADYITIQLGINDQSHIIQSSGDGEDVTGQITVGTIDSTDRSTFFGAWNIVLEHLITNHPFAHIGIIITNGFAMPNGQSSDLAQTLYDAEIALAKKWGLPYLDLNGDARCPMMHRANNPDACLTVKQLRISAFSQGAYGTHPNSKAYEYESTFIENFLRSI